MVVTVYLKSGTSWTVPSGCKLINVTLYGGGAGGVGGAFHNPLAYGGYGGSASTDVTTNNIVTTPGSTITYAIGAGGAGGYGYYDTPQIYYAGTGGTTSFTGASSASGAAGIKLLNGNRYGLNGSDGVTADGLAPGGSPGQGSHGFDGAGGAGYGAGGGGGDGRIRPLDGGPLIIHFPVY